MPESYYLFGLVMIGFPFIIICNIGSSFNPRFGNSHPVNTLSPTNKFPSPLNFQSCSFVNSSRVAPVQEDKWFVNRVKETEFVQRRRLTLLNENLFEKVRYGRVWQIPVDIYIRVFMTHE